MEVVNENEESDEVVGKDTLQDERNRMQANVQKASQRMSGSPEKPRGGLSRKPSVPRGTSGTLQGMRGGASRPGSAPMRTQSLRSAPRPLAPTKSTDHLASMRASRVQRSRSSRVAPLRSQSSQIAGAPRRLPPGRTSSVDSTNSLRAFRRDQANAVKPELEQLAGSGRHGSRLSRNPSDLTDVTGGDLSCFTMDSVNLRKTQLVADPIFPDDGTYNETDSYADHESVSRASMFSEYAPGMARGMPEPRLGVQRTPSRLGAIRVDRRAPVGMPKKDESSSSEEEEEDEEDDDKSFGSMTSGLTQDFTEHDFLDDSDDEDEHEVSES